MAKKKRRRTAGRWLLDDEAVIILRGGDVIAHAHVIEKSFSVETEDLGRAIIPTKVIKHITYKDAGHLTDELLTVGGSIFHGNVLPERVRVRPEEQGDVMKLPKAKISGITW